MAKKSKLKLIPLGGLDEIGKNMTVLEYGNENYNRRLRYGIPG